MNIPRKTKFILIVPISILTIFMLVLKPSFKTSHKPHIHHLHVQNHLQLAQSHCDGTLYPDLCISTVSTIPHLHKKSLTEILRYTISVTEVIVRTSTANVSGLESGNRHSLSRLQHIAVKDCLELLSETSDQLETVLSETADQCGPTQNLSSILSFLSAAMTNQFTCLDGFAVGSNRTVRQFIQAGLYNISHHVSNSLVMMKKIHGPRHCKHKTMPLPYDDLDDVNWLDKAGFPGWMKRKDRRLLQTAAPPGSGNTTTRVDLVVAKDGSGNFTTIKDAVAAAPKKSTTRFVGKTVFEETSPKLHCKTSTPSSPHSPSTFSLLLKNSLRLSKMTRCGVCLHNVKTGQGTAIFTAECSHSFHFPCITALAIKNNGTSHPAALLCCPLCGSQWKEAPFLGMPQPVKKSIPTELRLYDDDEPLVTHVSSIQFNPIPESEEENEDYNNTDDDFPGFFSNTATPRPQIADNSSKGVKVTISPESAVIAVGRSYETYAVLLTVKAPPFQPRIRRPSVDVVAVIDIGGEMNAGKLHALKRGMRAMISSLSSNDRLSMVVFSSTSKRLLPLRRMTPPGRRSARRIIDAINLAAEGACLNDALRKAAKVIQDRKEKNHFAAIVLMDGHDDDRLIISSTRFSEIPVHTFKVRDDFSEEKFVKSLSFFLSVVVLDVRVQLGLGSGSAAAEIVAVYSCTGRPGLLSPGSAKLGDMYSSEEREILVELKVPASTIGSHHMLSVRSYHKDPSSCKQVIYGGDQTLSVPRPHTIRSSEPKIQRLRSLFVMTRAVAESRRLVTERNDLVGAERLLASARAVLSQPSLKTSSAEEYRRRVEAELAEVKWRRQAQPDEKRRREKDGSGRGSGGGCCVVDEKGDPLTPTSAWKAAERLAKVAMMRKNLNRVSDLHGFEDARF